MRLPFFFGALLPLVSSLAARADTFSVSFVAPQLTFSFDLDTGKTPDFSNFYFFQYYTVSVNLNGVNETVPVEIVDGYEDYTSSVGGLFGYGDIAFGPVYSGCQPRSTIDCVMYVQAGAGTSGLAPIFGGSTSAPILYPGTYTYSGYGYEIVNSASGGVGTLSITDLSVTAVTPEPSSIALLGTGMLGVAGLVRKRLA